MSFWGVITGQQSLGEFIQLAQWDIEAAFGDKDAKSHAESLRAVNAQATPTDRAIYNAVESAKIKHTGLLGELERVGDSIRGLWRGLWSMVKALPWILVAAGLLLLLYLLWPYLTQIRAGSRR